jgi:cytochrome c-type biogenesis protein CcmE
MLKGSVITALVATASIGVVMTTFLKNASPYVTMAQAMKINDDRLHLAGDLLKDSIHNDLTDHTLRFKLRDSDGTVVQVIHKGEMPANLAEATKVVAIGGVEGKNFVSTQLLVKCPSKYEADKTSSPQS